MDKHLGKPDILVSIVIILGASSSRAIVVAWCLLRPVFSRISTVVSSGGTTLSVATAVSASCPAISSAVAASIGASLTALSDGSLAALIVVVVESRRASPVVPGWSRILVLGPGRCTTVVVVSSLRLSSSIVIISIIVIIVELPRRSPFARIILVSTAHSIDLTRIVIATLVVVSSTALAARGSVVVVNSVVIIISGATASRLGSLVVESVVVVSWCAASEAPANAVAIAATLATSLATIAAAEHAASATVLTGRRVGVSGSGATTGGASVASPGATLVLAEGLASGSAASGACGFLFVRNDLTCGDRVLIPNITVVELIQAEGDDEYGAEPGENEVVESLLERLILVLDLDGADVVELV